MFVPVQDKLNELIPDPIEIDSYNYFCEIAERMIVNGHEAHKTIPGYQDCKPEIETYKVFDGIEIPVHGYADFKGKVIEKGSDSKNKVPEATFKDGLRDVHGKLIENPDGTKTDYYKETYMKKTKPVKKKVKEKLDPMGTSGETEKQYQARL